MRIIDGTVAEPLAKASTVERSDVLATTISPPDCIPFQLDDNIRTFLTFLGTTLQSVAEEDRLPLYVEMLQSVQNAKDRAKH